MSGGGGAPVEPPGAVSWEQAVLWLLAQPELRAVAQESYFDGSAIEAGERYWNSEEWRAIRALLPPVAGRALDMGAGRGIASYALARDGWDVSALEPDSSALVGAEAIRTMAAQTGLPICVSQGTGERQPYGDAAFDLVFARQALHHANDLATMMREVRRTLKPGGVLIAVRDHVISNKGDLGLFLQAHVLHRYYGGENALLRAEYLEAMRGAGLQIKRVIAPLRSPINYWPQTAESLATAIADRIPDWWLARRFGRAALKFTPLREAALRVGSMVDNRPGRLYSFLAVRPRE